jgi:hypothetical protein
MVDLLECGSTASLLALLEKWFEADPGLRKAFLYRHAKRSRVFGPCHWNIGLVI